MIAVVSVVAVSVSVVCDQADQVVPVPMLVKDRIPNVVEDSRNMSNLFAP